MTTEARSSGSLSTSSRPVLHRRDGYQEAVSAVAREARCSHTVAKDALAWAERRVREARKNNYQPVALTHSMHQERGCTAFAAVFPLGNAPEQDTAAQLVANVVLDSNLKEYTLLYSRGGMGTLRVFRSR